MFEYKKKFYCKTVTYLEKVCEDAVIRVKAPLGSAVLQIMDDAPANMGFKSVQLATPFLPVLVRAQFRVNQNGQKYHTFCQDAFWATKILEGEIPSEVQDASVVLSAYALIKGVQLKGNEHIITQELLDLGIFEQLDSLVQSALGTGILGALCQACKNVLLSAKQPECSCGHYSRNHAVNALMEYLQMTGYSFVKREAIFAGHIAFVYKNKAGAIKKLIKAESKLAERKVWIEAGKKGLEE